MESCIYVGQVRHTRRLPVWHRFRYRLFQVYLDLDELPEVFRGRWLWSTRRPALARFRRENHLGDPQVPLIDAVRTLVETQTGRRPAGPVRLLTHLSYFGYCFNPVSFYYCFAADGRQLETIVAEVNNTPWGERHCYVLPVDATAGKAGLRFSPAKAMHVSPFMPMDMDYDWSFSVPQSETGTSLRVFMASNRDGQRVFDAGLLLERREISTSSLALALLRFPLMTLRIITAIHWQALKLWLKRVPFHVHPDKKTNTVVAE